MQTYGETDTTNKPMVLHSPFRAKGSRESVEGNEKTNQSVKKGFSHPNPENFKIEK